MATVFDNFNTLLKESVDKQARQRTKTAIDVITTRLNNTSEKAFDVWEGKDYIWTAEDDYRKSDCPYVQLTEYMNVTDTVKTADKLIIESANAFLGRAANTPIENKNFYDIYKGLYELIPTGNVYKFPYIEPDPFQMSTSFKGVNTDTEASVGGKLLNKLIGYGNQGVDLAKDALSNASYITDTITNTLKGKSISKSISEATDELIRNTPLGTDYRRGTIPTKQTIKTFDSANAGTYNCTFSLINSTEDAYVHHYELIRTLYRNIAPSYPNVNYVRSPFVYRIFIPSIVDIPIGYIKSFNASPIGTCVLEGVYDKYIVPAAYTIKLSFGSMFPISKQMIDLISQKPSDDINNAFVIGHKDYPLSVDKFDNYKFPD